MLVAATSVFSVNREVLGALIRAANTAKRKTFDEWHMLAALARIGSVAHDLAAAGVDVGGSAR